MWTSGNAAAAPATFRAVRRDSFCAFGMLVAPCRGADAPPQRWPRCERADFFRCSLTRGSRRRRLVAFTFRLAIMDRRYPVSNGAPRLGNRPFGDALSGSGRTDRPPACASGFSLSEEPFKFILCPILDLLDRLTTLQFGKHGGQGAAIVDLHRDLGRHR